LHNKEKPATLIKETVAAPGDDPVVLDMEEDQGIKVLKSNLVPVKLSLKLLKSN